MRAHLTFLRPAGASVLLRAAWSDWAAGAACPHVRLPLGPTSASGLPQREWTPYIMVKRSQPSSSPFTASSLRASRRPAPEALDCAANAALPAIAARVTQRQVTAATPSPSLEHRRNG